ncbi:hypothetical protein RhiirA5_407015 [Rhizophagus irregularis]|uniref:Uncharacterized protein n=3 Tax=Rhizophagus irregularis TaxID=588596 RepID=U9T337_RHIID|nr:hypothetical protein GLOIN_2v1869376 [Rhizophagus irregularis DAOM 181602=DAOM 197198]EXX75758.1 hypothetical protein RirG_039120 [Rhizophagus irregularis DAOM 197198w]PKC16481.1 hypothetical protein RhiirA5_407015 [Rhizophagus irregularis]PKC63484.1 hypothetical protein RhiirA1_537730 [Rhizophagus irregularis]PKK70685.1 hypothetical protein RhiirC2_779359 [Rhizophagus irregularis]PKY16779.1 hypothetical protein RhiirB3_429243 [Rhizophagus irregularis]|eukprot:XP_025186795.1 hypothetical protein GLOIN_2v1869376 [Rhizophagus irregularis DAOM 181602=DAOM 197198]
MNDTSNSNVNNSFTISHISDDLNLQQQQQYYQQHISNISSTIPPNYTSHPQHYQQTSSNISSSTIHPNHNDRNHRIHLQYEALNNNQQSTPNNNNTIPPDNSQEQYDANNIPHHSYRQSSTFENVSPPRCYSKTINQNNPRQCIIFQNDTIHHQTNAFYDNATNNSVFMQFCFDSSLTSNPQPRSQQ